jgi:carbon-monoxide dehydrogenase medium subunit
MILPDFEFHEPATVAEACELMVRYRGKARVLAGGTDLLVNMKKKLLCPTHLISLGRIQELSRLDRANGTVRIGAGVTVSAIAASETLLHSIGALCQGACALGTPLIRNLATIGGNIGSARPAADLPPALMVYGAQVELTGSSGQRRMPVADFFKGPGMTAAAADEIITAVVIEVPQGAAGAGYLNLGVRKAQDCNIVNVASFLELDPKTERIRTARIALGSVGPTPLRALTVEKMLIDQNPTDPIFDQAADVATRECSPILDFRGSSQYRRDMVKVLTRRTLSMALSEARSKT